MFWGLVVMFWRLNIFRANPTAVLGSGHYPPECSGVLGFTAHPWPTHLENQQVWTFLVYNFSIEGIAAQTSFLFYNTTDVLYFRCYQPITGWILDITKLQFYIPGKSAAGWDEINSRTESLLIQYWTSGLALRVAIRANSKLPPTTYTK